MGHACRKRERLFAIDSPSVRAFFHRRHPQKTAHCLAASVAATPRAAQKWLDGTATPNFKFTMRMVEAYGAELLALMLPGAGWLTDAAFVARRADLEAQASALAAELAALGPSLTEMRARQ